jgi:hypothetical protein
VRQFLVALFLFGHLFVPVQELPLKATVQVADARVSYRFGEDLTFEAKILSDVPILETFLFFQAEGANTLLGKVNLEYSNALYRHDLRTQALRPFTRVYYWFHLKLQNGEEFTSPSFWFDYEDNRFEWQTLENGIFQVRWYEGDLTFGQKVLNIAQKGLETGQKTIPVQAPKPLKIYVYASDTDLQTATQLVGQPWVAGYAHPDLGAVMVSVHAGPEENLELERKIPHEITHILLAQSTGTGYFRLPTWLVEGLATASELYPNPDHERALQMARQEGSLFPINSLCGAFPQNASGNFLAYAQSASFTRYLLQRYGTPGIQSLKQSYIRGVGCEEGVLDAFGEPLRRLENQWQAEILGISPFWSALDNLLPYLFLLGLILVMPLATILHRWVKPRKNDGEEI